MICIARTWKPFVEKWNQILVDMKLQNIIDVKEQRTNHRITVVFGFVFFLAALNYVCFIGRTWFSHDPFEKHNSTFGQNFFTLQYPGAFAVLPFNIVLGCIVMLIDIVSTASFVLNDSLIVVISLLIAQNFETLNQQLLLNLSVSLLISFDNLLV